ncbi:cysteine dioxygenase family protein [Pseudonocardia nematodicida]|uniref:Cysteine dioxygenase family protein n=1 Tax=Pseudonocardia nematodicida TaxID=1206997 RepID=A0ABV1KJI8_9PSEU
MSAPARPAPARVLAPARAPHAQPAVAPSPYGLDDLLEMTREIADEVRAGVHEVVVDPDRRWYRLLRSDGLCDVWLISWATEQIAELHDHAGSLGALTVVSGTLTERRWTGPAGLRTRNLRDGRGAGFPLGHVHDVANTETTPAVSVHAYSPPLSAMSYYSVEDTPGLAGQQRLRRTRTELVAPGQGVG